MAAGRKNDNSGSVCDVCVVFILIRNFDFAKLKLIFWFTPPVLKLVKHNNSGHEKPESQRIVSQKAVIWQH